MKLFILDVAQLTSSYHSGGGLVVVAEDIERAKEIISTWSPTNVTEDEWNWANVYDLDLLSEYEEATFIFPDAGCC